MLRRILLFCFYRLAYVEKKKSLPEPPANQSQAVVRRALSGGSYAEALKKSQPKINPVRREAKAKLLKKLPKAVAKFKEGLKEANSEEDSIISQQLSDNSSSNQPPPPQDQGITPKKNMTTATEQTTDSNQNEQSTFSDKLPQWEIEVQLAGATKKKVQITSNEPSKNTKPEPNNLTPNPPTLLQRNSSAKGTNPSQKQCTSKTLFCQKLSAPTIDFTDIAMEDILNAVRMSDSPVQFTQSQIRAALQAADVSGLFSETLKQAQQRLSEKTTRVERRKVRESVKRVPLEVNSKAGVKEDPAMAIPQGNLHDSAVNAIHSELLSPTAISKDSQKPPTAQHGSALSAVSTDVSVQSSASPSCGQSTNTLHAQSDEQGIPTAKGTAISPSKFTDKDYQTPTKMPAQAKQVQTKTKEVKSLALKSKVTEKENTNKENEDKLQEAKPCPSPQPPTRPEGRWHPFTTDWSCVQKVRCQHRKNGKLPKNVTQW